MNINDSSDVFIFNVFNSNLNIKYNDDNKNNFDIITFSYSNIDSNTSNISAILHGDYYGSNYYFAETTEKIGFSSINNNIKYKANNHNFNGNVNINGTLQSSSYDPKLVTLDSRNMIPATVIPDKYSYGLLKTGKYMGIGTTKPQSKLHIASGNLFLDQGRIGINTLPGFSLHINSDSLNIPSIVLSTNNTCNLIAYANKPFLGIGTQQNCQDPSITLYSCGKILTNDLNITRNANHILYYDINSNLISYYPINVQSLINLNTINGNEIRFTNSDISIKGKSVYDNISIVNNINQTLNNYIDKYYNNNNYISVDANTSNLQLGSDNGLIYNNKTMYIDNILTSNILNPINIYDDGLYKVLNIYSSSDNNLSFLGSDNNLYYYTDNSSIPIIKHNLKSPYIIKYVNNILCYLNNDKTANDNNDNIYIINGNNPTISIFTGTNESILDLSCIYNNNQYTIYFIDINNKLYKYGPKSYQASDAINNMFTQILPNIKFIKIECCSNSAIILDNNNNLYNINNNNNISQITLPFTKTIKYFSCGSSHTLILCSDYTVWSFGTENNFAQLGRTTTPTIIEQMQIPNNEKIIQIKCSNNNSILRSIDNNIYICGQINTNYATNSIYKINTNYDVIDISCGLTNLYLLTKFNDIYDFNNNKLLTLPLNFNNISVKSRGSITIGNNYINNINNIPNNSLLVQKFIGIGIGGTVSYNSDFSFIVNGNINILGNICQNGNPFTSSGSSSTNNIWQCINNGGGGNISHIFTTSSYVGINTTSPQNALDIYNGNLCITGGNLFVNGKLFDGNNSSNIYYGVNSNVGINTSSASYPLEVYDSSFIFTNIVFTSNLINIEKNIQTNIDLTNTYPQIINNIAISGDASTIVYNIYTSNEIVGSNNIFVYKNNTINQIKSPVNNLTFGSDIKISYDNTKILIGCYDDYDHTITPHGTNINYFGSIYVYNNSDNYYNFDVINNIHNNEKKYNIGETFAISKDGTKIASTFYYDPLHTQDNIVNAIFYYNYSNRIKTLINYTETFHKNFINSTIDMNDDGNIFIVSFNYDNTIGSSSLFTTNVIKYLPIYINVFNNSWNQFYVKNYLPSNIYIILNVSISGDGKMLLVSFYTKNTYPTITYNNYVYLYNLKYYDYSENPNFTNIKHLNSIPIIIFSNTNNLSLYKGKISKDGNFITIVPYRSFIFDDTNKFNHNISGDHYVSSVDNTIYTYRYNYITKQWINNNRSITLNSSEYLDNINFDISYDGFNSSLFVLTKNKDNTPTTVNSYIYSSPLYNNKCLIYGNDGNLTFGSNIIPDKNIDFYFNGITYASIMKSSNFIGDGSNITNIQLNHIATKTNTNNYLLFASNNAVDYSSNLHWSNETNTLFVDGTIIASNIINLNQKPILCEIDNGQIFFGDITSNHVTVSSNFIWNNQTCNLILEYGTVNAKYFIGDGNNVSNLNANLVSCGILPVDYGGTGLHKVNPGAILFGSSYYNIQYDEKLFKWDYDNSNLIVNSTITTDGKYITNIIASNLSGIISTSNGGTGNSNIPSGCLIFGNNSNPLGFDSNIIWNKEGAYLNVNGNINATNFIGDGSKITNISPQNINATLQVNQGGTGTTSLSQTGILYYNGINIQSDDKYLNLITGTTPSFNIGYHDLANSANTIEIATNIYGGSLILKNNCTFTSEIPYIHNNDFIEILNVSKGGTGNNYIPDGCLLFGSNSIDPLGYDSNIIWNKQTSNLIINGTVNSININTSKLNADLLLGNLPTSNLIGIVHTSNGGTGYTNIPSGFLLFGNNQNPLGYDNNLIWNPTTSNLIVTGIIASNVTSKFFQGDGRFITNIITSNLTGIVHTSNGGTGLSNIPFGYLLYGSNQNPLGYDNNLIWNSETSNLIVTGIITSNVTSKFFNGDGRFIQGINATNIMGILPVQNGGTGLSDFPIGNILYGNNYDNSKIFDYTNNLFWDINNKKLGINVPGTPPTPLCTLDVRGDINVSGDIYKGIEKYVTFSGWDNYKNKKTITTASNVLINSYNDRDCDENYQLKVLGNIYASGDITALSDERYKNNITNIDNALSKVESMRGVYFTRNDNNSKKRHLGLIAQEVEKIIPEVIIDSEITGKSIAYGNLVGLLIESIKELSNKIKILENK